MSTEVTRKPSHKSARAVATALCAVQNARLRRCRHPAGAWLQHLWDGF